MDIMRENIARSIGKYAREARKCRDLTQQQAAEQVGVSVEFYARMERGQCLPSLITLVRISCVLDVGTDYLLGLVDSPC